MKARCEKLFVASWKESGMYPVAETCWNWKHINVTARWMWISNGANARSFKKTFILLQNEYNQDWIESLEALNTKAPTVKLKTKKHKNTKP